MSEPPKDDKHDLSGSVVTGELMEKYVEIVVEKVLQVIDAKITLSQQETGKQVEASLAPVIKRLNEVTAIINGAAQVPQGPPATAPNQRQPINIQELLAELKELVSVGKEAGIIKGDEPPRSGMDYLAMITKKRIDQRISKIAEREAKHILNFLPDDDPFKEEIAGAITEAAGNHVDV